MKPFLTFTAFVAALVLTAAVAQPPSGRIDPDVQDLLDVQQAELDALEVRVDALENQSTTTTTTTTTQAPTTTTTAAPTTTTTAAPTTTTTPPASGWPDSSTTGPTGPLTKRTGHVTLSTPGQVYENIDLTGTIRVTADNVTIRNIKITATGYRGIDIRNWEGVDGLRIEDVEIDGNGADDCIAFGGYHAVRVELYDCADGAKINGDTWIADSYIHDLLNGGGCHCDGVQSTGSDNNALTGNNIDVPESNAAVMLGTEWGPMTNFTMDGNRIDGGNYDFFGSYGGPGVDPEPVNMVVTNNTFGNGPTHVYVYSGVTWFGNAREDGTPVRQ